MDESSLLTTAETAARLGVKKATVYAYVSRGLLSRTLSIDGKTSLFEPAEVARMARERGQRTNEQSMVIVSSVTDLRADGHYYRGRAAADFLAQNTPFEDVANWLWQDDEPWPDAASRVGPQPQAGHALAPTATTIQRFHVAVAAAGADDPLRSTLDRPRIARCGRRMITAMLTAMPPTAMPVLGPLDEDEGQSVAEALWPRISPTAPTTARIEALNAVLVLLADHGLAASTFAVRVATSVRADPYAIVQTGLGTVAGALHGGASTQAQRLIDRSARVGAAAAVGEILDGGRRVPGLGHKIYTEVDPRHELLGPMIRAAWTGDERLAVIDELERLLRVEFTHPVNIDFSLATLLWLADADPDTGSIFALARTAGWLAHAMEELDEAPARFRPRGSYVDRPT